MSGSSVLRHMSRPEPEQRLRASSRRAPDVLQSTENVLAPAPSIPLYASTLARSGPADQTLGCILADTVSTLSPAPLIWSRMPLLRPSMAIRPWHSLNNVATVTMRRVTKHTFLAPPAPAGPAARPKDAFQRCSDSSSLSSSASSATVLLWPICMLVYQLYDGHVHHSCLLLGRLRRREGGRTL